MTTSTLPPVDETEISNTPDWISSLCDDIDDLLATAKELKFNTHKNRKVFCGKLRHMIINAIHLNTVANRTRPDYGRESRQDCIIKPNPNKKSAGFAVMTPELSQAGDDLLGVGPNAEFAKAAQIKKQIKEDKLKNQKAGIRKW